MLIKRVLIVFWCLGVCFKDSSLIRDVPFSDGLFLNIYIYTYFPAFKCEVVFHTLRMQSEKIAQWNFQVAIGCDVRKEGKQWDVQAWPVRLPENIEFKAISLPQCNAKQNLHVFICLQCRKDHTWRYSKAYDAILRQHKWLFCSYLHPTAVIKRSDGGLHLPQAVFFQGIAGWPTGVVELLAVGR